MASYLTQLLSIVYDPEQLPYISLWGVRAIGVSEPFCCSLLPAKPGVVLLQSVGACHRLVFGEDKRG